MKQSCGRKLGDNWNTHKLTTESPCFTTWVHNAPEATIIDPGLTTVKIHSSSMGYIAADILLSRIANPHTPYKKTYIETDIILRESTGSVHISV